MRETAASWCESGVTVHRCRPCPSRHNRNERKSLISRRSSSSTPSLGCRSHRTNRLQSVCRSRDTRDERLLVVRCRFASVGAWLSLVEHSVRDRGVGGSNPLAPTKYPRYVPVTWVTDYSEHIGNTFEPKGFSIGSTRPASSSK